MVRAVKDSGVHQVKSGLALSKDAINSAKGTFDGAREAADTGGKKSLNSQLKDYEISDSILKAASGKNGSSALNAAPSYYLTRHEEKKWKHLSAAQKRRVIRKAGNTREARELERIMARDETLSGENQKDALTFYKNKRKTAGKSGNSIGSAKSSTYNDFSNGDDKNGPDGGFNDSSWNGASSEKNSSYSGSGGSFSGTSSAQSGAKAASQAGETAAKSAETAAEDTASVATGAATGGTSEAVRYAVKAARKMADMVKKSVHAADETEQSAIKSDMESTGGESASSPAKAVHKFLSSPLTVLVALINLPAFAVIGSILMPVIIVVTLITNIFAPAAQQQQANIGLLNVSEEVMAYRDTVQKYADQDGIGDYVDYLLAIMMTESGGRGNDVMGSCGTLDPSTVTPELSIQRGVKCFATQLSDAKDKGCDIKTAIQAYNYGGQFINYVVDNGKKWTIDLAIEFAKQKSGGRKVPYKNAVSLSYGYDYRYDYGGMFYVPVVCQYLLVVDFDDETVQKIVDKAQSLAGTPYVWGGASTTGTDCSGFTMQCFREAGISLPHSAEGQYDMTQHFTDESQAKAGDLVFFTKTTADTSKYITHVELYLGDGRMIGAGDPVAVHDFHKAYYQNHFVAFGRVK